MRKELIAITTLVGILVALIIMFPPKSLSGRAYDDRDVEEMLKQHIGHVLMSVEANPDGLKVRWAAITKSNGEPVDLLEEFKKEKEE